MPPRPGSFPVLAIRDRHSNIVPTPLTRIPCSSTHATIALLYASLSQVIRFKGETQFKDGEWVGVELAKALGKNDGSVQGVVYFECDQEFGLFVRPNNVAVSVYDAMHGDFRCGVATKQGCMCPPRCLCPHTLAPQCSRQLSGCIPTCQVHCVPSAVCAPCPFHSRTLSIPFPIPSTPSSYSLRTCPLLTARYLFPLTMFTATTLSHPKAYSDHAMAAATIQAFQRGGVSVTLHAPHTTRTQPAHNPTPSFLLPVPLSHDALSHPRL